MLKSVATRDKFEALYLQVGNFRTQSSDFSKRLVMCNKVTRMDNCLILVVCSPVKGQTQPK